MIHRILFLAALLFLVAVIAMSSFPMEPDR